MSNKASLKRCRKCDFEFSINDMYCPKCGERVRGPWELLFPISTVLLVIVIVFEVIVIRNIYKGDNNSNLVSNSSDIEIMNLNGEENRNFEKEEHERNETKQNTNDQRKSLDDISEDDTIQGSFYKCQGFFSPEFDKNIIGKTKEELFEYTGLKDSDYQYYKLNEGGLVFVSERRDYEYEYDGTKSTANSIFVYRDDKVVSFSFSVDFSNTGMTPQNMDNLYKQYLSSVSQEGAGVSYSDEVENVMSFDEYTAELAWKDNVCYSLVNVDFGCLGARYCSVDYIDNYKYEDIYAADYESAFKIQESDIKAAP